jgi:hypothetical protein
MEHATGNDSVIDVADLTQSPAWFPLEVVDQHAVGFVYLDEAAYREASFLDQRLLRLSYARTTLGLALVQSAASRLEPRLHYVFHTGHVGSTLISRLIGAQQSFFSLREPALLRAAAAEPQLPTLAAAAHGPALALRDTLALLARTWRASQRAVVKVTSFVSELAEQLLARSDQPAAIFMFAEPLAYLRSIFAGPNSRVEARTLAPARVRRLVRRLAAADWCADPHSEGELIAMSWLCEMLSLHQASLHSATRPLWVNFDTFLSEPLTGLQTICRALGAEPAVREIEALVTGPIMQRYSKAPEYAYDASLRRELLQSADLSNHSEIKRGMEWLNTVAKHYPLAQAVLESVARRQGLS